jgi:hypothetical protein
MEETIATKKDELLGKKKLPNNGQVSQNGEYATATNKANREADNVMYLWRRGDGDQ